MAATTERATKKDGANVGKIVQIIGPVLDVEFDEGRLPEIHHALQIGRAHV